MERIEGKTLLVLTLAILVLVGTVTITPVSAQTTIIEVKPNKIINLAMQAGSTFKVEVWVNNVANLAGVEFKLGYNTTVLTATKIEYGGIFGDTYDEQTKTINDAGGWLIYAIMENWDEDPFTGSGRAADVTFTVDSYGSSSLDLYETKLGDPSIPPTPIEHILIDSYFRNKMQGDIDGDHDVDYNDFLAFAASYLKTSAQSGYNKEADTELDGDVDYNDFLTFASNYLKTMS